jgi:hepatic leukemia factor
MNGREFDPRTRAFSDEELKPQVMVKKSRKKVQMLNLDVMQWGHCIDKYSQFVPEDMKDDKYWARRRKNNIAAKRSRDARRVKENQIALRAGFLEKEVLYILCFISIYMIMCPFRICRIRFYARRLRS